MLVHFDKLIRMDDRQIKTLDIVFGKFCAYHIFTTNQVNTHAIFTSRLYCAQDYFAGRVVTPHSIQGNPDSSAHAFFPSGPPIVVLTSSTRSSRSKGL